MSDKTQQAPTAVGGKVEEGAVGGAPCGASFDPSSLQVKYGDWRKAVEVLDREGVVVLTGAFGVEEVAGIRRELQEQVTGVSPSINFDKFSTWKAEALPPQTRPGMFQATFGNLPAVWKVRSHPRFIEAFRNLHAGVRGLESPTELGPIVTSVDGLTIKPPTAPWYTPPAPTSDEAVNYPGTVNWKKDWAHTDQTAGHYTLNIQGQAVLTQTTAGFVCSTRSHRMLEQMTTLNGVKPNPKNGWNKLKKEVYEPVAKLVKAAGGHFQVPVRAPVGSMVFWFSSTLHSAKFQDQPASSKAAAKEDWRMVIYVCHRPLNDVGDDKAQNRHAKRLQRCFQENRLTNHSGDRMFPKNPSFRFGRVTHLPHMDSIVKDPAKVYTIKGLHPTLDTTVAALLDMTGMAVNAGKVGGGAGGGAGAGAGAGAGGDAGGDAKGGGKKTEASRPNKRRRKGKKHTIVQHFS